jgi:hypothetical protein
VGIVSAETSFCNNGCSSFNMNNPFSVGGYNANAWNSGDPSVNFDSSLQMGLNTIVKLENSTYSDNQPLTALYDQNNSLGQLYVAGSNTVQNQWEDNVNTGFRALAQFIGLCQ